MSVQIIVGDALGSLRQLATGSVQCCVTSPPYWGLRDYGTAQWDGGDAGCDHIRVALTCSKNATSTLKNDGRRKETTGHSDSEYHAYKQQYRNTCGKCGAKRIDRQIGQEPTPDAYVQTMVEVFREVRRVLHDSGTVWLNMGDSYATGAGSYRNPGSDVAPIEHGGKQAFTKDYARAQPNRMPQQGLKPKDLVGIPWRVAFALQADGWWLRQDIIYSKPNPMPESVRDRCTKSHEYIFLLAKSERYYFDADAIAEPAASAWDPDNAKQPAGWDSGVGGHGAFHRNGREKGRSGNKARKPAGQRWEGDVRNKRSVWTVATHPFPGAHFATFPPKLIEPCILAGCPEGGTVLDPFGGAGTTGLVADELHRHAILIELNPAYAAMAAARIKAADPMFAEVSS